MHLQSALHDVYSTRVVANQMAKRPQKHLYKGVIHAAKRTERAVSCMPVYHPSGVHVRAAEREVHIVYSSLELCKLM